MEQKFAAPISALVATLISVGRLGMLSMSFGNYFSSISILEYLFGNGGILEPDVSLHLILATAVLWMIIFSLLWLLLSLISRDVEPMSTTNKHSNPKQITSSVNPVVPTTPATNEIKITKEFFSKLTFRQKYSVTEYGYLLSPENAEIVSQMLRSNAKKKDILSFCEINGKKITY